MNELQKKLVRNTILGILIPCAVFGFFYCCVTFAIIGYTVLGLLCIAAFVTALSLIVCSWYQSYKIRGMCPPEDWELARQAAYFFYLPDLSFSSRHICLWDEKEFEELKQMAAKVQQELSKTWLGRYAMWLSV